MITEHERQELIRRTIYLAIVQAVAPPSEVDYKFLTVGAFSITCRRAAYPGDPPIVDLRAGSPFIGRPLLSVSSRYQPYAPGYLQWDTGNKELLGDALRVLRKHMILDDLANV